MENLISCIRKNLENDVISNYPRKDADYLERLKSFEQVEDFPISKEKAAIAGFEYIGPEDRLRVRAVHFNLQKFSKTIKSQKNILVNNLCSGLLLNTVIKS